MPSNLSDRRVSPLRARMIEDMTMRGFTEKTRRDYVRHVHPFAAFIGHSLATATPDDIRGFHLYQRQGRHAAAEHQHGGLPCASCSP